MDLYAYAQIETLDALAKSHGINVPRLRGYRLMKDEEPVSREKILEIMAEAELDALRDLCRSRPFWSLNPDYWISDDWTDYVCKYYLVYKEVDGKREPAGIRWDRIHGWKRRRLKFAIKKCKRRVKHQFDLWNKYCGRQDVLYIHAKIGGCSWTDPSVKLGLSYMPWFLNCADDWWDGCYCDIYAKLDPEIVESFLKQQEDSQPSDSDS